MKVTVWDGEKIGRPGIYSGVPINSYHADLCVGPSISSGGLRKFEDPDLTPAHFYDTSYLNPEGVPEPDKESWILGRAAHTLFLGEGGFKDQFVFQPDTYPADDGSMKPWHGAAKFCKRWKAEVQLKKQSILKPAMLTSIKGMASSLGAHPEVHNGILSGFIEHSIVWQDRETGVWLKSRPDSIPRDSAMIVDLKTTDSASRAACNRSISDYGYHIQLALAAEGLLEVADLRITDFFLVFVETKRPHLINVKPITAHMIHRGQQQLRRAVRKFADCLEKNEWPGYPDDGIAASFTDFLEKRLDRENEAGELPDLHQED